MSFLDRLARFDSTLERGLDNSFALIFGEKVVPAEIEELLKQEAQDNLQPSESGRAIAPNVFAVGVSSKDLENLSQDSSLPEGLADVLARFGRNQGWDFAGPLVITIAEESGLHTGQLRVSSYEWDSPDFRSGFDAINLEVPAGTVNESVPEEKDPMDANQADTTITERVYAQQEPQPSDGPVVNLLLQDGSSRTYQVKEGSNIIGRATDADLRLPDTGVSRQHAEIMWDGADAVLVDLQSTNGTNVNDTQVENWLLADGDVISVGHSRIEVRIIQPGSTA